MTSMMLCKGSMSSVFISRPLSSPHSVSCRGWAERWAGHRGHPHSGQLVSSCGDKSVSGLQWSGEHLTWTSQRHSTHTGRPRPVLGPHTRQSSRSTSSPLRWSFEQKDAWLLIVPLLYLGECLCWPQDTAHTEGHYTLTRAACNHPWTPENRGITNIIPPCHEDVIIIIITW